MSPQRRPPEAPEGTLKLDRYAPRAKSLVVGAQTLADDRKHVEVEPIHLLARALDRHPGVAEVFRRAGADPNEVSRLAEATLNKLPKSRADVAYLSPALLDLLDRAERESDRDRAASVGVEHLLNALAQELRGGAGEVLSAFSLGPGAFRPHLSALQGFDRANTPPATPSDARARYTRDLVEAARNGELDPVIGLDPLVRRLMQILERRQKSHPLLVGEPGIGKFAAIQALAQRIAQGDVPSNLAKVRLYALDTGTLAAGAKLRGELEERLKQLVAALTGANDEVEPVLVLEQLDLLFGQGATGAAVGDVLRPLLSRGEIRIVGTTTPEGLRKIQDRDPHLAHKLTMVRLEPPSVEQSLEILRGIASRYEQHHNVDIDETAVRAAVSLAKRYVSERALPDSAIDLLDETAARRRIETDGLPTDVDRACRRLESLEAQLASLAGDQDRASQAVRGRLSAELDALRPKVAELRAELASRKNGTSPSGLATVTETDVAETLASWTGIPVAKMMEGEAEKLLKMEERLAERVIGQNEGVRALARAVRRGRVGLRDPGKPIGSFLFLGPSGVGKTELAKALAELLFDDEQALTRLDMSEFMERHMAQRLVGAPPGYVDSEQGGFLTEAVRRRPYSVLLFDEVEKAHADVFNLLLQLLDDGRLTDGRGNVADFSNTVVIMTSNIGSSRILEADPKLFESPEGREALRDVLMTELRDFFRPELLNRIDDTIVFRPLGRDDLRKIIEIQLRRLNKMLEERSLTLSLTDAAKDKIVDLGYEPAFGARPLKRVILKTLQDPLAEEILAGGYVKGDTILVDVEGDELRFRRR